MLHEQRKKMEKEKADGIYQDWEMERAELSETKVQNKAFRL